MAGGELGQQGDAEACGNEGANRGKFSTFAGDARFKTRRTAGFNCCVASPTFVQDEWFFGQSREFDGPSLCDGVGLGCQQHERFTVKDGGFKISYCGGKLDDAEIYTSRFNPMRNGFRGSFKERQFDLRMFLPECLNGIWKDACAYGRNGPNG